LHYLNDLKVGKDTAWSVQCSYAIPVFEQESQTTLLTRSLAMSVNKQELDKAVNAALNGPELRDVRFAQYRFNVKPAKINRSGGTVTVVGGEEDSYISRRRRARANDRIYYEFDKTNGTVHLDEIDIDIDRGGIARGLWRHREKAIEVAVIVYKLVEEILSKRGGRAGETGGVQTMFSLTREEQAQLAAAGYEESKQLLDGSWEGEATFLVMNIALNAR
jgi:hypothetical protein